MLEAAGRDRAQSMALIEWLDEAYPQRPLLPADLEDRYTARELAYAIATEMRRGQDDLAPARAAAALPLASGAVTTAMASTTPARCTGGSPSARWGSSLR